MTPAMALALLGVVPWVALGALMAFLIREPRPLTVVPERAEVVRAGTEEAVAVSIIVPARNEAHNIRRCVQSLAELRGVRHEVIVVDDRSTDETAKVAREVSPGRAARIVVVDGSPLPEGWFGKPWACRQGAAMASGERLLFTDADTEHHPDLLARALAAMKEDRADALSLLGHQEMGTIGEKLVQPQIFTLIGMRFRGLDRVVDHARQSEAIANGQFVLVTREAYDTIGGHEAVKGEVVEDLRMAQVLVGAGFRLTVRRGEDVFSTRMYTSLRELVDGWTKNVSVGTLQSAPRWGRLALPGVVVFLVGAWLLPPAVALRSIVAVVAGAMPTAHPGVVWAGATMLFSIFIWAGVYRRFGVSPGYALAYPAGALIVIYIMIRSGRRGRARIEWKGRRYGSDSNPDMGRK